MASIFDALNPGQTAPSTDLVSAIDRTSDRITQILNRNANPAPSLGDIGTAALRSWGGGQTYGQGLESIFQAENNRALQDVQLGGSQIDLETKKQQLMQSPEGQKFKFLWDTYTEGLDPDKRIALLTRLQEDPEQFTPDNAESLFARAASGIQLSEYEPMIEEGFTEGDTEITRFRDPNTGEIIEEYTAPRYKPTTTVNVAGAPPTGYMYTDDSHTTLVPIPGGPATRMNPADAAKTELVVQGISDVKNARDLIVQTDPATGAPSIDRTLLGTMTFRAPGTKGREVYGWVYNAVEAKLRAESGAAVPEMEVDRMAKRFVPSPLDSDEEIISKLDRLEEFMSGTLDRIVPPEQQPDVQRLIEKYGLEE